MQFKNGKIIAYNFRVIDSFRFMSTSSSELVDMSENFHSIQCKSCTENNRCEECKELIDVLIKSFLGYINFAMAI